MSAHLDTPSKGFEEATACRNALFFQVFATVVVIYDHITTFDLEVELIWKKKISSVQVLYFINRYTGDALFLYGTAVLVLVPSPQFQHLYVFCVAPFRYFPVNSTNIPPSFECPHLMACSCVSFGQVQSWLSVIALNSMQAIMVHRIVSMYRHQKVVLTSLLVSLGSLFVATFVMNMFTGRLTGLPIFIGPMIRTCIPIGFPPWAVTIWFLVLAFDLVIFTLAMSEGLRYLRESKAPQRTPEESEIFGDTTWSMEGSLVRILLRDSIFFPFLGLVISLFNILGWYILPVDALQYTANIAAMGSPILGCRLILNLRDAYYRPFADEFRSSAKGGFL